MSVVVEDYVLIWLPFDFIPTNGKILVIQGSIHGRRMATHTEELDTCEFLKSLEIGMRLKHQYQLNLLVVRNQFDRVNIDIRNDDDAMDAIFQSLAWYNA